MSIRMFADTTTNATQPRYRDVLPRPTAPAKSADPISLFTRDELRQMVLELMG